MGQGGDAAGGAGTGGGITSVTDGDVTVMTRGGLSDQDIVGQVERLVDIEAMVTGHQVAAHQAENVMKAKPDDLPHRLVSHFQQLFEVRSVSGVLPRMTELYLYVNETNNFVKVLRNLLGLSKYCSYPPPLPF